MPYLWVNRLLEPLGLIAVVGAIVLAVFAIFRGKGRRKGPLLGAIGCLVAFVAMGIANYALIAFVQLPSLARESERQAQERVDAASLVQVGDPAPPFAVTDTTGAEFVLDDLRGKIVVVNFFATWCGPCLKELPHLQQLWDTHRDSSDVVVLVIGREETMESVSDFQSEHGYTFPMAADTDRAIYSLFADEMIPRTYVVAADGKICLATTGFAGDEVKQVAQAIADQRRSSR